MSSNDPNDVKYVKKVDTNDKEMVLKLIDEIELLKKKLEKVTKIAEEVCDFYSYKSSNVSHSEIIFLIIS